MNLLIDPLPTSVTIRGQDWPINSDFYAGVLFELLMQDPAIDNTEKVRQALALYYPDIPRDMQAAADAMLWFYRCGEDTPKSKSGNGSRASFKKAYCFDQDADLIFAAFYGQYHIDLSEEEGLHWWKFRALFAGLSSECEIKKIMGYRTADLSGMNKAQKKHYEKMRKIYALQNKRSVESSVSLAARNQRMKDYVARRFAEVEATTQAKAGGQN